VRVAYLESCPPSLLLLMWGVESEGWADGGDEERAIRDV